MIPPGSNIPEAVIQFRCSWWWVKISLEHVEQPRNNKLSYTVASCWSFSYIISWCMETWMSSSWKDLELLHVDRHTNSNYCIFHTLIVEEPAVFWGTACITSVIHIVSCLHVIRSFKTWATKKNLICYRTSNNLKQIHAVQNTLLALTVRSSNLHIKAHWVLQVLPSWYLIVPKCTYVSDSCVQSSTYTGSLFSEFPMSTFLIYMGKKIPHAVRGQICWQQVLQQKVVSIPCAPTVFPHCYVVASSCIKNKGRYSGRFWHCSQVDLLYPCPQGVLSFISRGATYHAGGDLC
jgi:hypothetical protein